MVAAIRSRWCSRTGDFLLCSAGSRVTFYRMCPIETLVSLAILYTPARLIEGLSPYLKSSPMNHPTYVEASPFLCKWRDASPERDFPSSATRTDPGKPRKHDDETILAVVETTQRHTPKDVTHWIVRSLAKNLNLARNLIHRVWSCYGDSSHIYPGHSSSPSTLGLPEPQTHDYKRYGTTNLFVALTMHQLRQDTHRSMQAVERDLGLPGSTQPRPEVLQLDEIGRGN